MNRDQRWLLPPSLNELPPLDGPSCFVAEFVDIPDGDTWTELGVEIEGPVGSPGLPSPATVERAADPVAGSVSGHPAGLYPCWPNGSTGLQVTRA